MTSFNLSSSEIQSYLKKLGKELNKQHIDGELIICGGAAMLLDYGSRETTKDIDGIYAPKTEIKEIARKIANDNKIPDDWLNDSVKYSKSFMCDFRYKSKFYKKLGGLKIYIVKIEQLLAMKLVAFRIGMSHDLDDLEVLLNAYNENIKPVTAQVLKNIIIREYGKLDILTKEATAYIDNIDNIIQDLG